MKLTLFLIAVVIALAPPPARADSRVGPMLAEARELADQGDDLDLRLIAIKASGLGLNRGQWAQFRNLLHHRPGVGWDLISAWDRMAYGGGRGTRQARIEAAVATADKAMSAGKFVGAARLYDEAAHALREHGVAFGQPNFFFYQTLLQSYARALYGAGKFGDSLQVYQWISINYPFIRQVQFEKMWAAFRAGNYSMTLGAIASQMSSYFSRYLEPESYLLQYYLYRRLCRAEDVRQVKQEVLRFNDVLNSGRFTLDEWARRDIETLVLLRLTHHNRTESAKSFISAADRDNEVAAIKRKLQERYNLDIIRLKSEMEKVVAYLNLATEAKQRDLPAITNILGVDKVLNSSTEMWTVEDTEDWLDEIGHHVFIGQSQCRH